MRILIKSIFQRIPIGDNTLNKEKVIRICDRNLEWLKIHGKIPEAKQLEIFHVDQPDFKEKVLFYLKNDYPFVMRGINLSVFRDNAILIIY